MCGQCPHNRDIPLKHNSISTRENLSIALGGRLYTLIFASYPINIYQNKYLHCLRLSINLRKTTLDNGYMSNEKIFIPKALKELDISRASLYNYLKKLDITPRKEKNRSFLSKEEISIIKDFINGKAPLRQTNKDSFRHLDSKENEHFKIIEQLTTKLEKQKEATKKAEDEVLREREENKQLLSQVGKLEGKTETLEEQNNKLFLQVGKLVGKAETLEEQNQKLLEASKTGIFRKFSQWWKK